MNKEWNVNFFQNMVGGYKNFHKRKTEYDYDILTSI